MADLTGYLLRLKKEPTQTVGILHLYDGVSEICSCYTMELAWKNNEKNISCIPTGEYDVEKFVSTKHGECFLVKDVPERSAIEIHKGNFNFNTKGCILPGTSLYDINHDGLIDVVNSDDALRDLLRMAPNGFKLIIT